MLNVWRKNTKPTVLKSSILQKVLNDTIMFRKQNTDFNCARSIEYPKMYGFIRPLKRVKSNVKFCYSLLFYLVFCRESHFKEEKRLFTKKNVKILIILYNLVDFQCLKHGFWRIIMCIRNISMMSHNLLKTLHYYYYFFNILFH
jgi:hypothetical protein